MKEKYLNIITKTISIVYLLFIIYLLITNIYHFNIFNILGIIISIILIYLITKLKTEKKVFFIMLLIVVLSRIYLLFLDYKNILGDYSFFYGSSISLSKNLELNNSYIALFPYLYSYIFILGNIMKIIGIKYISVIITNLLFEIIGGIFFYLLMKRIDKFDEKKCILIYIYNPFNIIWITICSPVIITNTFFIICIYIFYILKDTKKTTKKIILSILLGMFLAIANSFRPIIIIFLIALLIYIIFTYLKTKKVNKYSIASIFICLFIYVLTTFSINAYIAKKIDVKTISSKSGWSLYVGANYEEKGMWNQEDSNYLTKIYKSNNHIETQNILKKEAINRYKKLNIKTIPLLVYKSILLTNDVEIYSYDSYNSLRNNEITDILKIAIKISLATYMYYILITNLIIIIKNIKNKKETLLFPTGIYAIGLFVASLLVEISPRYFMPITIPLMIYSTQLLKKEEQK